MCLKSILSKITNTLLKGLKIIKTFKFLIDIYDLDNFLKSILFSNRIRIRIRQIRPKFLDPGPAGLNDKFCRIQFTDAPQRKNRGKYILFLKICIIFTKNSLQLIIHVRYTLTFLHIRYPLLLMSNF